MLVGESALQGSFHSSGAGLESPRCSDDDIGCANLARFPEFLDAFGRFSGFFQRSRFNNRERHWTVFDIFGEFSGFSALISRSENEDATALEAELRYVAFPSGAWETRGVPDGNLPQ